MRHKEYPDVSLMDILHRGDAPLEDDDLPKRLAYWDWTNSPHDILKAIDRQLSEYGLEVVTHEDPDMVWSIEKRAAP